jgi:hypothetical protein
LKEAWRDRGGGLAEIPGCLDGIALASRPTRQAASLIVPNGTQAQGRSGRSEVQAGGGWPTACSLVRGTPAAATAADQLPNRRLGAFR